MYIPITITLSGNFPVGLYYDLHTQNNLQNTFFLHKIVVLFCLEILTLFFISYLIHKIIKHRYRKSFYFSIMFLHGRI